VLRYTDPALNRISLIVEQRLAHAGYPVSRHTDIIIGKQKDLAAGSSNRGVIGVVLASARLVEVTAL
jgi:hypothetical protein